MLDSNQIKNSFETIKKYEDYLYQKAWMQGILILGIFSLIYSIINIPYVFEIQNVDYRENFPFPEFLGIYIGFYKLIFLIITFIGLIIIFLLFKRVKRTYTTEKGTIFDRRDFSLFFVLLFFWFFTGLFSYIYNFLRNELILIPYLNNEFDSELINDILYYLIYSESHLSIGILTLALVFLITYCYFQKQNYSFSINELLFLGVLLTDLSIILGTLRRTIEISSALEYIDSSNLWIINPTMFYIGLLYLLIYLFCYLKNNHLDKKIIFYSGIILFPLSFLTGRFTITLFYEFFKFDLNSIISIQITLGLIYSFINSIILIVYAFYLRKKNNLLLEH